MKLEDAVQSAKNKGYSITELEPQYHDTVPEGCIISQVPGENYEADPGTVIQVVVSLGVREVSKTPDMTGKTFIQAVQELNQLGIIYDVVIQNDPAEDDPKDIAVVFDQMPEPGSDFENSETGEKKTLTLYVSTGNADILVKVPPLENKTEAEAETLLAEAGLRLGEVTREHHDSIEEGKIIAQSHGAGSSAARDTAVSITVSDGPGEDQTIRKTGGSITIANPLMATEDGHLSVIAYDKDGRQTTLFNADITYFTFSEDNKTMTLAYPDDTWYIRVNLNYVELLYLNVNH